MLFIIKIIIYIFILFKCSKLENIKCWGRSSQGQLGKGSISWDNNKYDINYIRTIDENYTNLYFNMPSHVTCFEISHKDIYCYGEGKNIGYGSTVNIVTYPIKLDITSNSKFGINNLINGIDNENLFVWGENDNYRFGISTLGTFLLPQKVNIGNVKKIKKVIIAGLSGSCFFTEGNEIYCSGNNLYGQLATGDFVNSNAYILSNMSYINNETIIDITSGTTCICLYTNINNVYCWGYGVLGTIGDGNFISKNTFTKVQKTWGDGNITGMAMTYGTACIVLNYSLVYCWGEGKNGRLGNGDYVNSAYPVKVNGTYNNIIHIFSGFEHICMLCLNNNVNQLYCWGLNNIGQLGISTEFVDRNVPTLVLDNLSISKIGSGYGHTCMIYDTVCFGYKESDPLVCSGKGKCIEYDKCQCNNPSDRYNCGIYNCFNIIYNDTAVCSGHGTCNGPDKCDCHNGYTGIQCELYICNTKNSSDTMVCGGKGVCVAPEKCICTEGFLGLNCESNCLDIYSFKELNDNLNKTLTDLYIKNFENEQLNKDLNKKNFENEILIKDLKNTKYEIEKINSGLYATIGIIIFISIFILFLIIFIFLICFCFCFCFCFILFTFSTCGILFRAYFKKYKKKMEIEKKLLGEKKINNNNIINNKKLLFELKEDDFKIELKSIKNLDNIGEGASAIVFKGNLNKQLIALKLFKTSLLENENYLDDFKKELKIVSKLKHIYIVNFIGYVLEPNKFGICLEYCENGTLKKFLEQNKGKMSFDYKIKLLIEISKGMEYLHFKKIIHRDLKPDNILITKDLIPKITDFGISKNITDGNTNTKTMLVGTSLYMAPEVVKSNNYTYKCDVFSFSIIMYQVLTENLNNVYETIKTNEINSSSFNIEYSVANDKNYRPVFDSSYTDIEYLNNFTALIKKCWDEDPNTRPEFNEITMSLEEIKNNIII